MRAMLTQFPLINVFDTTDLSHTHKRSPATITANSNEYFGYLMNAVSGINRKNERQRIQPEFNFGIKFEITQCNRVKTHFFLYIKKMIFCRF